MTNWSARGAQAAEMFQTLTLLWDGTPYSVHSWEGGQARVLLPPARR